MSEISIPYLYRAFTIKKTSTVL